jgi:transposase
MKIFTEEDRVALSEEEKRKGIESAYLRRLQAMRWLAEERNIDEVSLLSGYSQSSLRRLRLQYERNGIKGLRSHYVGSNNRKLSYEKEAEILAKLSDGAASGQYVRGIELLKQFIQLSGGIGYQIDAFYRLLHRHGWRKLMPRGQHPKKANDEAIEASKKLT